MEEPKNDRLTQDFLNRLSGKRKELVDFVSTAKANMKHGPMGIPSPSYVPDMLKENFSRSKRTIPFNISFLDKAFMGISPNDLIVMAAPPGAGKTELSSYIALKAALSGKSVYFFALEADRAEIESRNIYRMAAHRYFNDPKRPYFQIDYEKFYYGTFDERFIDYIGKAAFDYLESAKTLYTVYRQDEDFTIKHYQEYIESIRGTADLIVLDHLNYFDTPGDNENRELTVIVKKMRDLVLLSGVPVLLVVHLRKRDKRNDDLIPSIEQIHGTSNITKIATKIFTIARKEDPESLNDRELQTYIRIGKYRVFGAKTMYSAISLYNLEKNIYEKEFLLGRLINGGTEFEAITEPNKIPMWAHQPKQPENYLEPKEKQ